MGDPMTESHNKGVISESRTTETCLSSVWLVCCSTCSQSKSRLVTKHNQNDVTLLNKFLLIVIFAKTCIKVLHIRHNNCVTRKLSHISTQTHQLRTRNAVCICRQPYLFTFAAAETVRKAGWLVRQTQLKHVLCLTVNSFPKSRLFANINVFKLFDLPKSCVKFLMGNPMTELAIWDHAMLLATRHKRTHPALTPASKAGTQFTYPRGMKGWVDLLTVSTESKNTSICTVQSPHHWQHIRRLNVYLSHKLLYKPTFTCYLPTHQWVSRFLTAHPPHRKPLQCD